jgi:hypothetical protein
MHQVRTKIIYCLGGPEMSIDSLMLGSIYSRVKELLRKLPLFILEEKWHRGHRHRGGEKGKHKGRTYLRKLQDFRLENPQGEGQTIY